MKVQCNMKKNDRLELQNNVNFQWVHKKICTFCTYSVDSLHFHLLSQTHTRNVSMGNVTIYVCMPCWRHGHTLQLVLLCCIDDDAITLQPECIKTVQHSMCSPHPKTIHCAELQHWSDAHDHNNTNKQPIVTRILFYEQM